MKLSGFFHSLRMLVVLASAAVAAYAQSTTTLPNGQVGTAYSATIQGPANSSYSISGLTGSGLSINASSGVVSGTPTTATTYTGVISVAAGGVTNNYNYTLTIAGAAAAPAITSASTASGTVGTSFSYTVSASNSPTSFNVGTLPAGLSFNSGTNVISGTPTSAGTTNVSLSANNSAGTGATTTLAITISPSGPVPVVNSSTSATATAATSTTFTVNYTVTASNSPVAFAATGLPLGVSINSSTGAITGTTSVTGVYTVGLTATNNNGTSATVNLTLTVGSLSTISNATTLNLSVGTAMTPFTTSATNSATSFNASGVPAGLSFNATTGVLTGTPTSTGTFSVTLSANNAIGTGPTVTLTIVVGTPVNAGGGGGVLPPNITNGSSAAAVAGEMFTLPIVTSPAATSFSLTGNVPTGLTINATTGVISGIVGQTGVYPLSVIASNSGGSAIALINLVVNSRPTITAQPVSTAIQVGANATLSVTATGIPAPTFQWRRNGVLIAGAQGNSLFLANFQVGDAGAYSVDVTNVAGTVTSQSVAVGVASTAKVVGAGNEVGQNIVHPNGNIYDQVLLTGSSATITADNGQVTRVSFIDLNDDIVQVEFGGAGTLTLTLENASGPAAPVKYNQPGVTYMKGHASLVITGANETTNLSVFSVGTVTAVNQTLFPAGVTYDGMADIGLITIASSNGKFGGIRTANTSYFRTSGLTGIYAPGVAVLGPVFIGDITADGDATGAIVFGSSTDVRITGGDLLQMNGRALQVDGLTAISFTAGTKSSGAVLPAQTNRGRLERNGVDMTGSLVR